MVAGGQRSGVRTADTMCAGARALPTARGLLPHLYYLSLVALATASDYGVPIEIKLWDSNRTPLSQMVDTTNEFGLKVLAEHNFLNDNNIAFSPYGLMGILVALYEGVDGESSYQIQRGMHLPWNRNVMRIGFRDIHRTLKTYFVPEEGFLAGLALNNENVTFNDSYKKVLRFYGFDLEDDQLPTLSPENGTTLNNTTGTPQGETLPSTVTMENKEGTTMVTREDTTLNPNAETLNEIDIRGPTTTPMSSTTDLNTERSQSEPTPGTDASTTNRVQETIPTTTISSMPIETTTTTTNEDTSTLPTTNESTTPPIMLSSEPTNDNEVENIATVESIETTESTTAAVSTVSTTQNESDTPTTIIPEMMAEQTLLSTTDSTTTEIESSTTTNDSTIETLERKKKSVVDFIFTNPPYIDDYLIYRSYDVGLDLPIPNFDNKMFLANGLKSVQVTYMHYDTVLEHAYLPHLEAAALRLPLDSDRYYLLVVLPSRAGAAELGRLLSRMARESDLSDVYSALRPRRVRAVVPSFTVKGHVTLTTDLQKLGIRDVFEPRQHDFTPMTRQPGVYVRSIEQAVSVAIRKYRPDDQKQNRYVTNRQPVTFTATYPFLYFVVDASIHVALMAGKMVDPLNTRIL